MYVTRPLSLYIKDQAALSHPPPEGPNSGYLVIMDKKSETHSGFNRIKHLPFPQNKNLTVTDIQDFTYKVLFIPVLNLPLSANCYYVIWRQREDQGKACTSSNGEDNNTCCWGNCIVDMEPSSLHPFNTYQQFEIRSESHSSFHSKPIAPDGIPPAFLRESWWQVNYTTPKNYHLDEALGVNSSLRAQLPDFNFSLSTDHSESVIVGKWYCPFMFVKEAGISEKEQMQKSMFYEMTLEQRWEKIFSKENSDKNDQENAVLVDVVVQTEVAKIGGSEAVCDEKDLPSGRVLRLMSFSSEGATRTVGLSLVVVERMKWEQERVGWIGGDEGKVRVERMEEFMDRGIWEKFGCYVLVESFVLKRMDGSLMLTYDYKHTHEIRSKWE